MIYELKRDPECDPYTAFEVIVDGSSIGIVQRVRKEKGSPWKGYLHGTYGRTYNTPDQAATDIVQQHQKGTA
jgi:hypothetical protein